MSEEQGWHLDKKVPISLIAAIALQTMIALIWATKIDSRVDMLERQNSSQDTRITKMEEYGAKIAVMESRQVETLRRLDIQTVTMQRILDIVAKLEPRAQP